MKKSLFDISWQVDEPTYREDHALSYSTLAKYERCGFNGLDTLSDKVESPSLLFGSAVDSIITGGMDEFSERFMVAEYPECPDSIITIVKILFNRFNEEYSSLKDIPNDIIIGYTEELKYQLNWKPETRAKVIKEKGLEYYNLMALAMDRIIINSSLYEEINNTVNALKESDSTEYYFRDNNPFDDIERLYQLKFKATIDGVDYRCMADEIIVDHKTKEIFLIDLKTSSHTEWDFFKSFVDWRYKQEM